MGDVNYSGGKSPGSSFRLNKSGVLAHSGPFIGEVMSTVDPVRSGRIRVWIKTFGDENSKFDESSWFTVRYMSPFYGVTPHQTLDAPDSDFEENGHSYGMWFNTPDVGVEVLVMFVEGDPNQGYYIGFLPKPQMNHMIPAIGAQDNPHYNNSEQETKCSHAPRLPVVEINKKRESINDSTFTRLSKPIHSVVAGQMWKQGILADTVRGPISSSSQRESPSRVYGVNTPGRPIYASGMFDHEVKQKIESGEVTDTEIKGRRGGHSFVMDDGDIEGKDNLIRIRTSSGHQILLSDDGKSIYIIHANGNTWFEMGAEGTIDMYAANSINFRTQGDINFHADKNINLNAMEKVNMYSKQNITIEAEQSLVLTGKNKATLYSRSAVGVKSDGTLTLDAGSSASWKSGGDLVLKGATIGLNHGSASTVTAPAALTLTNFPDVVKDETVGWKSEASKFKSVVSRAPTHEPYDSHNTGISNVKPFD